MPAGKLKILKTKDGNLTKIQYNIKESFKAMDEQMRSLDEDLKELRKKIDALQKK